MMQNRMKTVGITGGVGCGKSRILDWLEENVNCIVLKADSVAHEVEEPNHEAYEALVSLCGQGILRPDGFIDKEMFAKLIFGNDALLAQVNAIIHPAVKKEILKRIREADEEGIVDYFFVEAALLIEDGYEELLDEIWYIYADKEVRCDRLRSSRGYSDEKIDSIMEKQLSHEEFMVHSKVCIDNSGSFEDTVHALESVMNL